MASKDVKHEHDSDDYSYVTEEADDKETGAAPDRPARNPPRVVGTAAKSRVHVPNSPRSPMLRPWSARAWTSLRQLRHHRHERKQRIQRRRSVRAGRARRRGPGTVVALSPRQQPRHGRRSQSLRLLWHVRAVEVPER